MNIRRRLASLESGPQQSGDFAGLVKEHIDTLLPLFVATEVIWWPFRASLQSNKVAVAIQERRRQYCSVGLPWSGPGGNSTNWKRSERLRSSLVAGGLITMVSRSGVPLVKLTDATLATMRALIGLPQLDDGAKVLRVAAAVLYEEQNPFCRRGGWVSEVLLSGRSYEDWPTTASWYEFESLALPLLICGAMESTSSTISHVHYRSSGTEPTYNDGPAVEVDEAIQDRYLDLWTLDGRKGWQPEDLAEVVQSLSATV